jgi:hypothetical protein
MAIPWPSSPTVGQTFTYGSITYTWNGVAWINTVTNTPATVGSVAVTAPIVNTGTPTAPVIGISQSGLTIAESQVTGLVSDLSGKATLASANAFTVGGHTITNAADTVSLSIIPFAGQSSSVFRVRNSTNTADLMTLTPSGDGKFGAIALGGGTIYGSSSFLNIASTGAGQIGAIIKSSSTQATDHLQYQSSAGTVLGGRNAVGQIYTGSTQPINYQVGGTPTATSGTGSVATITLTSASNLAVGDLIQATGFTTATGTYNTTGYAVVTAVSNTAPFTVSYAATGTGTASVFGQIQTVPQATISARNAATIPLIVKGNAYNVDMARWLYPNGATALSINAYGTIVGNSSANQLNSDNGNNFVLQTKGTSDQRGNHYQAINSSSTVIGGFNALGQLFSGSATPILTASGGTIQSIAIGANPLVTMASAHGFTTGDLVTLAGTTGGTYNGNFLVASTPASTTFTITTALTAGQASAAGTVSVPAQKSITSRSAGTIGAVIRGASSQTANLQEWQNSAGTVLARITSNGQISTPAILGTTDGLAAISIGVSSRNVQFGALTQSFGGGASVIGIANATTVPTSNPTGGGILYVDTGALKYRGTSGSAATIVNADGTMAGGSFTGGTLTSDLVLAAGSGTVEPLTFQTNSSTPTATSGALDYDGDKFYAVTSGTTTGRLMLPIKAWAYSNANATSATTNTAQSIFPIGARTLPLEAGKTYYFRLNLGANFTFSAVPASIQLVPTFSNAPVSIYYNAMFISGTSGGVQSFRATATTAQNISPTLGSTTSNSTIVIEGYFQSNATTGGTVEFKYQINTGGGSSATILSNSYEEIVKIGTGASAPLAVSGSWS